MNEHTPTTEERAAWVAVLDRHDARPTFEARPVPQRGPSPITPAMEAEADADIATGRVTRYDGVESFIAALDEPESAP